MSGLFHAPFADAKLIETRSLTPGVNTVLLISDDIQDITNFNRIIIHAHHVKLAAGVAVDGYIRLKIGGSVLGGATDYHYVGANIRASTAAEIIFASIGQSQMPIVGSNAILTANQSFFMIELPKVNNNDSHTPLRWVTEVDKGAGDMWGSWGRGILRNAAVTPIQNVQLSNSNGANNVTSLEVDVWGSK